MECQDFIQQACKETETWDKRHDTKAKMRIGLRRISGRHFSHLCALAVSPTLLARSIGENERKFFDARTASLLRIEYRLKIGKAEVGDGFQKRDLRAVFRGREKVLDEWSHKAPFLLVGF